MQKNTVISIIGGLLSPFSTYLNVLTGLDNGDGANKIETYKLWNISNQF